LITSIKYNLWAIAKAKTSVVDALAMNMFFWLVTEYAVRQDVTGQLKTKYQFFWFQKVNNILSCVREIIENEIIYS